MGRLPVRHASHVRSSCHAQTDERLPSQSVEKRSQAACRLTPQAAPISSQVRPWSRAAATAFRCHSSRLRLPSRIPAMTRSGSERQSSAIVRVTSTCGCSPFRLSVMRQGFLTARRLCQGPLTNSPFSSRLPATPGAAATALAPSPAFGVTAMGHPCRRWCVVPQVLHVVRVAALRGADLVDVPRQP